MVTSVVRADGTILYESEHHQERVLDPYVADQVTDVLVEAVERGTGTAAQIDRPVAGKTGTAQGWRNAMVLRVRAPARHRGVGRASRARSSSPWCRRARRSG